MMSGYLLSFLLKYVAFKVGLHLKTEVLFFLWDAVIE
jgi:hypothetical protein